MESIAFNKLSSLRPDSATGPDLLPARILKEMAAGLVKPVALLTCKIVDSGKWPDMWRLHWIVALHKKLSVYNPLNYRGIHLTAQLSKVVERILHSLILPYIDATGAFGPINLLIALGEEHVTPWVC